MPATCPRNIDHISIEEPAFVQLCIPLHMRTRKTGLGVEGTWPGHLDPSTPDTDTKVGDSKVLRFLQMEDSMEGATITGDCQNWIQGRKHFGSS